MRETASFEPSTINIRPAGRAVRETEKSKKVKKRGQKRYISRMRGGVAVKGGKLVLRLSRLLPDVINCAKADVNRAFSF